MSLKSVKISPKEIESIILLRDDCEAMIGGGDDDQPWHDAVILITRFLERNMLNQHAGKQILTHEK